MSPPQTQAFRPLTLKWLPRWVCLVPLLTLAACSTVLPPEMDKVAADKYRLLTYKTRVVSQVRFLDCNYVKDGFHKVNVTFWESPPPRRNSPEAAIQPGGGSTFIPMGLAPGFCPQSLTEVLARAQDVLPDRAPSEVNIEISNDAELDIRQLRQDANSITSRPPISLALRQFMARHGAALHALVQEGQSATIDQEAILAGKKPYKASQTKAQLDATTAALKLARTQPRNTFHGEPPQAVNEALKPLDQITERLTASQFGVERLISAQAHQQREQQAQHEAAVQVARRDHNQDICNKASTATEGEAPSESDMCFALLRHLEIRAEGFEKAKGLVTGMLGQLAAPAMQQAGSLRPQLRSFKKTGPCHQERDARAAFVCKFDANMSYENHGELLLMLKQMGISDLYAEAAFYKDRTGQWQHDLTRAQLEAQARSDEQKAREQQDQKEREARQPVQVCPGRIKYTMFGAVCEF